MKYYKELSKEQIEKINELFKKYGKIENCMGGDCYSCPFCKSLCYDIIYCNKCKIYFSGCVEDCCSITHGCTDDIMLSMKLLEYGNDKNNLIKYNNQKLENIYKFFKFECVNCKKIVNEENVFLDE
jgi:hypothetical protein